MGSGLEDSSRSGGKKKNSIQPHTQWKGVIHRYHKLISVDGEKLKGKPVTLFEGNTPLIESSSLIEELREFGFRGRVFFKHEGLNPTASFKDRGMTVAVSRARDMGARAIICASTGNTSASASAYGSRAGIPVFVVVPEKGIAMGKLVQAMAHGAKIIKVRGNFDDAFHLVKKVADDFGLFIVNSINPWRVQGQKTAAFEICDALREAPDYHFIPVGNAANIYAYWEGYKQYRELGIVSSLPKMCGFQAEGSAPIVRGHPIQEPKTIASAIRIGNPANWKKAELARDESDGVIDMVSDSEILKVYKFMGEKEGIFCEPASCAGVAGLIKLVKRKFVRKDAVVVCTITGHGLKDPESVLNYIKVDEDIIEPNFTMIRKIIEDGIRAKGNEREEENKKENRKDI